MDLITQAALGATVGALVLGPKIGRPAIGWGALLGILPDLDSLLVPFLDTAWDLRIHRGFTHSALCLILVSFALAKPFALRWKRKKVTPFHAGVFVFLVWSTHILIDCFTTYGTQVLWPFSGHPFSLDNLFIIDPLFTMPLLVAVVWGLRIDAKRWKKKVGVKMTAVCLLISSAYVGLSFWAKYHVSSRMAADFEHRGISSIRMRDSPAPFSILLWRGVIERDDEFWVTYRSVFDGDAPFQWTIFPKQVDVLEKWRDTPEVASVLRFSKEWCIARETRRGVWLVDMRFGEYREWDDRGLELRPVFAWEYQADGRGDPLKSKMKAERDMGGMMRRMWGRIWGGRDDWSAKPRLIGNPAVSQEYLPTVN